MLGNLVGHRFTRPKGLMQCESLLIINSTHPAQMPGGPWKTGVGQAWGVKILRGSSYGAVAKVLDWDIVVSEFNSSHAIMCTFG